MVASYNLLSCASGSAAAVIVVPAVVLFLLLIVVVVVVADAAAAVAAVQLYPFSIGQPLRIVDVRPYDGGTYVCRAANRLGVTEAAAVLAVEEVRDGHGPGGFRPLRTELPRVAAVSIHETEEEFEDTHEEEEEEEAFLEFTVRPHDMRAPKGTTAQLPCKARGRTTLNSVLYSKIVLIN